MRMSNKFFIFGLALILICIIVSAIGYQNYIAKPLLPATSKANPVATGKFTTSPPGARLPSETDCVSHIRRSLSEPRPDNYTPNHSVPTPQQISAMAPWGPAIGFDVQAERIRTQITGNFVGSTDEIFQWAACKWGIDEDVIRAEALTESYWHQSMSGDWTTTRSLCPPGTWDGKGCYQSYGMLQIKYIYSSTEWPMSRDDTAFNVEYSYALIRNCYEGWTTYLSARTPVSGYAPYHAGDLWGCIGVWYSGGWYDKGAIRYINTVKSHLANKEWLQLWF